MAEESWHEARLIPTSGINGVEEQERRATSALLAVMAAVKEFGRGLTQSWGAPAGQLETYIEVPFLFGEKKLFPDGLIRATRGKKSWTALVEVKTGTNTLAAEQIENYLEIARTQGFDAVVTISNEIPTVAGHHPTKIDKRKLRKVDLHHWSWSRVLSEAVIQKEHRGVGDPDQAWILGELIRYLEHPRSGALEFEDMGASWVSVRDAIRAGTLRPTDKGVSDVAARFDALLCYTSLRLGRYLGTEVTPVLTRSERADPSTRTQSLVASLVSPGTLEGAIKIPHTVGPLVVTCDLRAGRVTCHVDIDAPRTGRSTTRVNWLIRQLRDAPSDVRVEAFTAHSRGPGTAELLSAVRQTPSLLTADPQKELRSFRIAYSVPSGVKRGRGRGAFIDTLLDTVDTFYGEVMQNLRSWSAAPPRIREAIEPQEPVAKPLVSTALSSQDGEEPVASPPRPDSSNVREIDRPEVSQPTDTGESDGSVDETLGTNTSSQTIDHGSVVTPRFPQWVRREPR